ncbi:hypothetical protein [Aurantiacibacter spongiae]|uniref:Uncharacterized protein n=1 Tax=Aurantiacibacter spongiae TaxID=2488860 RepID=A0A3N5DR17_9SPHN|nr:hypothetical protein [Aurantiacibacter spongiae]RPF71571.1 hypothetical protein EG799_08020 [Aurantiacibacter spongiae]
MNDFLFSASLLGLSVLLPVLAARIRAVRWQVKAPACLALANAIPLTLLWADDPAFLIGPSLIMKIVAHLAISLLLVTITVIFVSAQGPA